MDYFAWLNIEKCTSPRLKRLKKMVKTHQNTDFSAGAAGATHSP
jgi:hypothetical protein